MEIDEARTILKISHSANWETVRRSYRRSLLEVHPDKGGGGNVSKIIKAFTTLKHEKEQRRSETVMGTRDEGPWTMKMRRSCEKYTKPASEENKIPSKALSHLYEELHELQQQEDGSQFRNGKTTFKSTARTYSVF